MDKQKYSRDKYLPPFSETVTGEFSQSLCIVSGSGGEDDPLVYDEPGYV